MGAAQAAVDRFVRGVEAEGLRAHGVEVLVGDEIARHRWVPEGPADIHSIAKSVCVIAAGIAADEGVFDLDAPVARYLPDMVLGAGVDEVTARHLFTMTSGIDLPWTPTLFEDWPDLAREFLRRPSRGRVSQYANASTYTAMRALAAVVGDVRDWLVPRLFEPLGIDDPLWDGRVLLAGGAQGPAASSAEVYDVATGTFAATGAMASPRRMHGAALLPSGFVLVLGGYDDLTGINPRAELYEPCGGVWVPTTSMRVSRYQPAVVPLADGQVLVLGGFSTGDQSSVERYHLPVP